jgi:hypothetical protein
MHGPAVEADDGDLVRLRLDGFEQLRGKIRTRGLQHRVAIGGEFGAHDVVHGGRQLVAPIDQPMPTGHKHTLELAVSRQ